MIKVKIPANSSRYIFNDSHTTQYILIIEKKEMEMREKIYKKQTDKAQF